MAITDVPTYGDAIEHLVDYLGGQSDAAGSRRIRKAVREAVQTLADSREWTYYTDTYRVNTDEAYSTGTIAYTHSTRTVTLTGGTWPTWARYGLLKIGNDFFRVSSRDSSTALTLDAARNPGEDVASGTSYVLMRVSYPLPDDFRALKSTNQVNRFYNGKYIAPEEWMRLTRLAPNAGDTYYYTVLGDPNNPGKYLLGVYGYPNDIYGLEFVYQRYPAECRFTGFDAGQWGGTRTGASSSGTGAATVSAGSTSVTINSGALLTEFAGCILRLSRTGVLPESLGGLNPYREQLRIQAVSSATALTVWDAPTYAYTTVGYSISSPIDIPPQLRTAFWRLCEMKVLEASGGDAKRLQAAADLYQIAFDQACAADQPIHQPRSAWDAWQRPSLSLSDMPMDPDWPNNTYP